MRWTCRETRHARRLPVIVLLILIVGMWPPFYAQADHGKPLLTSTTTHSEAPLAYGDSLRSIDTQPSGAQRSMVEPRAGSARLNETNLSWFNEPFGVVYDPVNGYVYVSDFGSDNVSIIDPSTDQIIAYVPLGSSSLYGGENLVCDPVSGDVYVGGASSDILVIGARTNAVISTIPITVPGGAIPEPMTYDAQTGDIFVLDGSGSYVSVVNETALLDTVSLPQQYADGAVYDSSNHQVYASGFSFPSCSGSCYSNRDDLSLINGSTFALVPTALTILPERQMMYLASDNDIYVAGVRGNLSAFNTQLDRTVAVLNLSADLGGLAYDPHNGFVYVTNRLDGDPYNSSSETNGTNVTVVDSLSNRAVGSIPVQSQPVGIAFDPVLNELFVANLGSGHVTVISVPEEYNVTFSESGLAPATNWTVSLDGAAQEGNGPTISFTVLNGTFVFSIPPVPGYSMNASSGTVAVKGWPLTVSVNFVSKSGPSLLSLPVLEAYMLLVVAMVAGVLLALMVLILRGHRKKDSRVRGRVSFKGEHPRRDDEENILKGPEDGTSEGKGTRLARDEGRSSARAIDDLSSG